MSNTATQTTPGFEPVPEGTYLARMNRIEETATKNGKGVMLKVGFQIVNGDFKNRLIFHNFLVEHTNPAASEIGLEQVDRYLQAVGVKGGFEDIGFDRSKLEDYLELPFNLGVKIETQEGYKDRNKVSTFKARG
jgi:hypothetical protein